uniref:Putative secreted protein n=1 Tax=Ixodes ricinus TaxID=34613 RepID=A0A147BRA2_IXORI
MRAAGRLFPTPGLQPAPFAFHCALAARACSRLAGRPSITKGRRLTLDARQLKDPPAVPVLSATTSVIPQTARGK